MIAFASNSILCRLALRQTSIDPATFTVVRILSGAIALWLVMQMRREKSTGNWLSAFALFAYAAAFSFAYLQLSAGSLRAAFVRFSHHADCGDSLGNLFLTRPRRNASGRRDRR